jgi:hypothetical protein
MPDGQVADRDGQALAKALNVTLEEVIAREE